jgi:hypothetical protein
MAAFRLTVYRSLRPALGVSDPSAAAAGGRFADRERRNVVASGRLGSHTTL